MSICPRDSNMWRVINQRHVHLDMNGRMVLWSLVENGFGIVAASLPALRAFFVQFFENRDSRTSLGSWARRFQVGGERAQQRVGNTSTIVSTRDDWIGSREPMSGGGIIVHREVMVESKKWSESEVEVTRYGDRQERHLGGGRWH